MARVRLWTARWIVLACSAAPVCAGEREFRLDAVELIAGRETEGEERYAVVHERYTYRFATAENRAEFLHDPRKYEVQMGGACGRMGPLSGEGSPEIYAVHAGRLYIFASEGCRKGFLSAPEKLIDREDDPPAVEAEAARRGRALLDKAVAAHGGAARIDAVRTYRSEVRREVDQNERKVTTATGVSIRFPHSVRRHERWGDWSWAAVATRTEAWFVQGDESWPMHAQQRFALEHDTLHRNLIAILQARHRPDFVVAALDAGGGGERVAVAFDGATTELTLDERGRVVALRYRGRGPSAALGEIERTFEDFREVSGVTVPHTSELRFDGKPVENSRATLTTIEIDGELPADIFRRP